MIDLHHREGTPWIVLAGDVDMHTVDVFAPDVPAHTRGADVCIDLGDVDFMDTCGLALLFAAYNHATRVRLVGVPYIVQRLIEVCGSAHLFDLEPAAA